MRVITAQRFFTWYVLPPKSFLSGMETPIASIFSMRMVCSVCLFAAGQFFDQPVEEFMPVIERFDRHALVQSVRAVVFLMDEEPRQAVHRDAAVAHEARIGGARAHRRNDRHAGP